MNHVVGCAVEQWRYGVGGTEERELGATGWLAAQRHGVQRAGCQNVGRCVGTQRVDGYAHGRAAKPACSPRGPGPRALRRPPAALALRFGDLAPAVVAVRRDVVAPVCFAGLRVR